MSLRIRRGTEAQRTGVAFDSGELVVTTDEFKLYVGDGITLGGRNIATNLGGSGIVYNEDTGRLDLSLNITADDVPNGVNNQYFSTELAQDAAASLLTLGQHIGIGFSYTVVQDGANRIDATVSLNLDDLGDVVISETPTNGQVLKYNSTAGKWVPAADSGTGGGLTSLQDDLTPTLGGDLTLNSHDITGTGNIDITGNISGLGDINVTGTITSSTGLGSNLDLNTYAITSNGVTLLDSLGVYTSKISLSTNVISVGDDALYLENSVGSSVSIQHRMDKPTQHYIVTGLTDGNASAGVLSRISKGTVDTPTTVAPGDVLSFTNIQHAHDGTNYVLSSGIGNFVDQEATVSTGAVPGKIIIATYADGVTPNGVSINSKGWVSINRMGSPVGATLDINGFAKLAILSAAPSSPANGMVAIADGTSWNPTSTGKQTMVVYLGGSWVQMAVAP